MHSMRPFCFQRLPTPLEIRVREFRSKSVVREKSVGIFMWGERREMWVRYVRAINRETSKPSAFHSNGRPKSTFSSNMNSP
ncbi:hypothetical protein RchiOBHm_Chr6g0276041 [Rosa chinensis]|uniref:Uncharacterized protein n=1 Tax=Rosa chinensis TaxID=74649 RepID=A0A2P6PS64_ROSCH|nr:hypothetical protein RchiOBHm_Chr6g0276041 [Rosa chinensis]